MRMTAQLASLHSAYWSFDRWYRLAWYVWPGALAVLVTGWICIDKPTGTAGPAASPWAKPDASAPPMPVRRSPTLALWPEKLQNDAMLCFSNAVDLNPLIEACTRLIDNGAQINSNQLFSAYGQRGFLRRLKQPDLALADYDAALKIQANAPAVLTNRAWIYMTRSRYDAALDDLNKAIEAFAPALAGRARFYRGYTYLRLKDYDRAMTDLDEALRVDKVNPDPYLARGETEQALQRYDAALRDFDEFSKHAPRDPRGLIGRGAVLEATGHPQDALAALDSAVALDPSNVRALTARDRLRTQQTSQHDGDDQKSDSQKNDPQKSDPQK